MATGTPERKQDLSPFGTKIFLNTKKHRIYAVFFIGMTEFESATS